MSWVNRRIDDIPVSQEAVRRRVMMAIHAVERETEIFLDRYMKNVPDSDKWESFVDSICQRENKKPKEVDTFSEFETFLSRAKGVPEITQEPSYHELRSACERGKMFDYIGFSLKNDLEDAYEQQLRRYCLSFAPEARGTEVKSPQEYENKIIDWSKEIGDKMGLLRTMVEEEKRYESPISTYVKNYDRIVHLMKETCSVMAKICEPMKRWVIADANYARKVQDEINNYNRLKLELRDHMTRMEFNKEQSKHRVKRKSFNAGKYQKLLLNKRDERRWLKRREMTIQNGHDKYEAEFHEAKHQLNIVMDKLHNRTSNSPRYFDLLTSAAESLREQMRQLDKRMDLMRYQIGTLRKEQATVQKNMEVIQAEFDKCMKQHENAVQRTESQEEEIKFAKNGGKVLEEKISTLKRVREIKLHSDTVKKIYHYGYSPGQLVEVKDELEEAFRMAAPDVGKDWPWLYQKLPFVPPRDYVARTHDIEVIDLSNRRLDRGFRHLALKSMEKWRRLSHAADLPKFVSTLKKIRKTDVAKKIQNQLLATS